MYNILVIHVKDFATSELPYRLINVKNNIVLTSEQGNNEQLPS